MLFTAIDHPAICCYDVRKLADWYCKTFGMRVIIENGKEPPALVIGFENSLNGGTMIELMPVKDAGPSPSESPRSQPGLRHLALRVSDFDAAYQTLQDAGVTFTTPPGQAVGGARTILFRDPEGNELQIVER
jgi:glyoxylase I family protein